MTSASRNRHREVIKEKENAKRLSRPALSAYHLPISTYHFPPKNVSNSFAADIWSAQASDSLRECIA